MRIRGIFFDAAGVLYRRPESTKVYVSRLLDERGLSMELSVQDQERLQAMRSAANKGQLSPDQYWDQLLVMCGIVDPKERKRLLPKIDEYSDKVLPLPGVREALAALKERGFLLGIVTDTIYPLERKMRWFDALGIAELIDVISCSTVVGTYKPDPAIYLDALQQAGLTPAESVFVGHDAEELDGACKVGITTVAVYQEPDAKADYYAQSLMDLLNVPILGKAHTRKAQNMNHDIEAIFLDHGNTLRVVVKDDAFQAQARQELARLIGTDETPEAFCAWLDERYKVCKQRAKETMVEASEVELWTRGMLPEWPPEKIAPLAGRLTRLWRDRDGRRVARPDTKAVIVELSKRGYHLGIIANTITETEIPDWLEEEGLSQYFETVILSSVLGCRKPGPEIYWEAARRIGVEPARSVYVGDNPSRDIEGTTAAGFWGTILLMEPATLQKEPATGEAKAEVVIHELRELLDIFPPRNGSGSGK
ncbi:MAG: HAD family hydrolase [Anaerolineae bacterium]|jgi:putative hydrolase of the HAD superfamily